MHNKDRNGTCNRSGLIEKRWITRFRQTDARRSALECRNKCIDRTSKVKTMPVVVRIKDRFRLTDRGTVYIVQACECAELYADGVLYDLQGNSFRLTSVEMIQHTHVNSLFEQRNTGILLQPLDGTDVKGNILVTARADVSFLFCNNPLYPQRVDKDYEEEYHAAGGNHPCALISYEDLEEGKISLYGEEISGLTIYRGWMLKPAQYRYLYEQLKKRNILLINTPEEYERYHLIPRWYDDFKEETPLSIWTEGTDMEEVLPVSESLEGPYIVKDYVKSRKHEWYDACYIGNAKDRASLDEAGFNKLFDYRELSFSISHFPTFRSLRMRMISG